MVVRLSRALLISLVVFVNAGLSVGAEYERTIVDLGSTSYGSSDWHSDGQTIVWRAVPQIGLPSEIVAANISNGARITIASGAPDDPAIRDRILPHVSGDHVVWVEYALDYSLIHTYDLSSGRRAVVAESTGVQTPRIDIDGDWIGWIGFSNDMTFVQARNLVTLDAPVTLATQPYAYCSRGCPEPFNGIHVSGDRIIWHEHGADPSARRFVQHHLSTSVQTVIGGPDAGLLDASGDIVALVSLDGRRLTVHNVVTGFDTVLVELGESEPVVIDVHTDGRYVFWTDETGALDGHNLSRGEPIEVPTGTALLQLLPLPLEQVVDGRLFTSIGDQIRIIPVAEFVEGRAWRTFPETGHSLGFGFLLQWESNGGLMMFGYPLSDVTMGASDSPPTQFFERQVFEHHHEHAGTPYEVELTRIGDLSLLSRGQQWPLFPKANPDAAHYFEETGHAIDPRFWDYWSSHGLEFGDPGFSFRESLALFGYPISEATLETNADGDTVVTQWFERAAFEWHPENPEEYRVLLRRLGAEALAERGWHQP